MPDCMRLKYGPILTMAYVEAVNLFKTCLNFFSTYGLYAINELYFYRTQKTVGICWN